MDRRTEFFRDMMQAFEDLPPDRFAKFRAMAAELEIPVEMLVLIACREHARERRRQRRKA